MVGRKEITYTPNSCSQTPMEVLHALLPLMDNITGFQRTRTSIFEDDCTAKIRYESLGKRTLLRRAKKGLLLELRVHKDDAKPGSFGILSQLNET